MPQRAKSAKAHKSAKNDGATVHDLEKRLADALKREAEAREQLQIRDRELVEAHEQQTATADILSVISSSPTDLQPVLDTVAENAARLCSAEDVSILKEDRGIFHVAAFRGANRLTDFEGTLVSRDSVAGRAMLDGRLVHLHDITQESETEFPVSKALAPHFGHRTMLAMPLLRGATAVGVIFARRTEVRPFSDEQIALLKTFADQAVIAIENVRLFTELQEKNKALTQAHAQVTEALEQQTATSEILRVISQSPTDVQPVFDAIVRSAKRLLGGFSATVTKLLDNELELTAFTATTAAGDAFLRSQYPRPLADNPLSAQVVRDRAPCFTTDTEADHRYSAAARERARARGFRSQLSAPLLREDRVIGVISVTRRQTGPFSDEEIALLRTFADQAVIAIENVRLFKELETRNRELRVALDQQTATSELLKVIGRSTFDLQPVFEALAENAVRLCEAQRAIIFRFDGRVLRAVAWHNASLELRAFVERNPTAPGRGSGVGRAALERRTIHIHDILADPEHTYPVRQVDPVRTVLAIPCSGPTSSWA
jgi:GAF domain-containing protein